MLLFSLVFQWPDLNTLVQRLPFYITYTHNYFHLFWPDAIRIKGLGHLWSLAIEEQFYLIWPFIVWIVPVRRLWIVCVLGLLFSLSLRIAMPAYPGMYVFTPMRLDGLMAGSLLAVLYTNFPQKILKYTGFYSFLLLAIACGGSYLANAPTARHVYYAYAGYSLLSLGFACFTGWVLTSSSPLLHAFFAHPWLIWLGKRSYGLYIFHLPVLYYGRQWLYPRLVSLGIPYAGDITLLLLNVLILVLAWASFRFFERPFLKLKKMH
jgi:peptidoglycan/LPS O-acetylase OafA/YrhL